MCRSKCKVMVERNFITFLYFPFDISSFLSVLMNTKCDLFRLFLVSFFLMHRAGECLGGSVQTSFDANYCFAFSAFFFVFIRVHCVYASFFPFSVVVGVVSRNFGFSIQPCWCPLDWFVAVSWSWAAEITISSSFEVLICGCDLQSSRPRFCSQEAAAWLLAAD